MAYRASARVALVKVERGVRPGICGTVGCKLPEVRTTDTRTSNSPVAVAAISLARMLKAWRSLAPAAREPATVWPAKLVAVPRLSTIASACGWAVGE